MTFIATCFLFLRMLLAFLLIPVSQKQLDVFRTVVRNSHRIRAQKNTVLPDGIPDHIYSFPNVYGLEECGIYFILNICHIILLYKSVLTYKRANY